MNNKEKIIGWVLMGILLIGFVFYQSKRTAEEQKKLKAETEQHRIDSIAKAKQVQALKESQPQAATGGVNDTATGTTAVTTITDTARMEAAYGAFATASTGTEKLVVLENDLQKVVLSTKGAQIKSIELKKYKTWDKKPLVLFTSATNKFSLLIPMTGDKVMSTENMYFEADADSVFVAGKDKKAITLRMKGADGATIEEVFTLSGDSYLFNFDVNLIGLANVVPANTNSISAEWNNTLSSFERTLDLERRYSALYYRSTLGSVSNLSEDKETDEATFDAPVEWISYKQQFFNTTLFSKGGFSKGSLKTKYTKNDTGYVKKYDANLILPYAGGNKVSYNFQYYIGPNNFNTLAALDRDLESIVKLGPSFWMFSWIRYITRFIIWVFSWFQSTHLNYGIIILLMTLMLKVILHPLTAKSIESAAKMKILAPELAALKEKYGDDQTKIGQEQMKLYQRAGVSPFGGCLPLLLQMPILMAMYYFFPASIELRQQPFLWATDLSSYDDVIRFGTTILGQNHISIFTILMTISSIAQAVMNNQMNSMTNQQPGMKYLPYIMPLMLMFVFNSFPAALTYYYLLQNLLGVAHQWIIQKFFINDAKLRAQIEENKKNPKKASGWQKKLEDMQREAQARQKQRK